MSIAVLLIIVKKGKQLSIDEWLNKMLLPAYNGMLLGHEKELISDTCNSMDEP